MEESAHFLLPPSGFEVLATVVTAITTTPPAVTQLIFLSLSKEKEEKREEGEAQ